jgi:hypothetical protein
MSDPSLGFELYLADYKEENSTHLNPSMEHLQGKGRAQRMPPPDTSVTG